MPNRMNSALSLVPNIVSKFVPGISSSETLKINPATEYQFKKLMGSQEKEKSSNVFAKTGTGPFGLNNISYSFSNKKPPSERALFKEYCESLEKMSFSDLQKHFPHITLLNRKEEIEKIARALASKDFDQISTYTKSNYNNAVEEYFNTISRLRASDFEKCFPGLEHSTENMLNLAKKTVLEMLEKSDQKPKQLVSELKAVSSSEPSMQTIIRFLERMEPSEFEETFLMKPSESAFAKIAEKIKYSDLWRFVPQDGIGNLSDPWGDLELPSSKEEENNSEGSRKYRLFLSGGRIEAISVNEVPTLSKYADAISFFEKNSEMAKQMGFGNFVESLRDTKKVTQLYAATQAVYGGNTEKTLWKQGLENAQKEGLEYILVTADPNNHATRDALAEFIQAAGLKALMTIDKKPKQEGKESTGNESELSVTYIIQVPQKGENNKTK